MAKPPAFPIAPVEYDADKINVLTRVLTQYLNQTAAEATIVSQKADTSEVLIWLS